MVAALATEFTAFTAVVAAEFAALATVFTTPVVALATAFMAPATGFCPKGFVVDEFISNVICQN